MPKGHRSVRSQGYYRLSPATTPTTQYAPVSSRSSNSLPSNAYYTSAQVPLTTSMSQQSYTQSNSGYPNGGPVQHPMSNQQYAQMAQAPQVSIRPSSGAWNPNDDQTLMAARAQGMNWAPIQQSYFPSKTPNACRKRHERLMERRNADDWDGLKLENMAKNYMAMRREIWSPLAAQTGEKWNVVEAKCMSQGLKNLQTAARSCARRERLLDPSAPQVQSHPNGLSNQGQNGYGGAFSHHTDDSGYADDLELEAESYDHTDGASERSGGSYGYSGHGGGGGGGGGHQHSGSAGSVASLGGMGMGVVGGSIGGMGVGGGVGGMGGVGQGGMMDSRNGYMMAGVGGVHQGQLGGVNGQQGQRLPSMDMGIDAIINRPSGGR